MMFDRYYKTNEVQRFRYDRPFHKGQKNKECEFAVSSSNIIIIKCALVINTGVYDLAAISS